jgi:polyhydroxyalkanoate synthesis regulator phasin
MFASGVGDLTRHRAEQIAKELVKSGEVRRDQAAEWAKVLFDASRENRQEITRFVRSEIQNQVQSLGLATTRDVERLEHRLDRIEISARTAAVRTAAKKSSVGGKTAAKKTVAKKPAAQKTTGPASQPPRPSTEGPATSERDSGSP